MSSGAGRTSAGIMHVRIRMALATMAICFAALGCSSREPSQAPEPGRVSAVTQAIGEQPDSSCTKLFFGGSEYWFCDDHRDWTTARSKCQAVGMDLVRVNSSAENTFLKNNVDSDTSIGATDTAVEGAWLWTIGGNQFWSGGSNGSAVGGLFANWDSGQPNNLGNQDCGQLKTSGKWIDEGCSDNEDYICETVADLCPSDPVKALPGACGCGIADTDTDADGTPNCLDACPADAARVAPGDCGCANAPKPAGTPCDDGLCAANTQCNGAGICGNPSSCPAPDSDCEWGFFKGTYYWFCDNDRSSSDARTRCQSVGMDLPAIETAAEDDFITDNIDEHTFVGGTDAVTEGTWIWTPTGQTFWTGGENGSAVPGVYTHWESGQPSDLGGRDCMVKDAVGDGKWETRSCTTSEAFACEHIDKCPANPQKTDPGQCGCNADDKDDDNDGKANCVDGCPNDPNKVVPGVGDCGKPETDTDGDGLPDCVDDFPGDPTKGPRDSCNPASGTAPQGTSCCDGVCPGTQACTASGTCGNPQACAPAAGCVIKGFGDSWYWFCPTAASWDAANTNCRAVAGRSLVRIETQQENAFLNLNLAASAWTGANDRSVEGAWRWATATSNDGAQFWSGGAAGSPVDFRFSSWAAGEPSTLASESCGVIDGTTGAWSDAACAGALGYVCEQSRLSLATCIPPATFGDGKIPGLDGGSLNPTPSPNCVPLSQSSLGTATALSELEACNNACTGNPPPQNCVSQCTGAATPPPPGNCASATLDELRYCQVGTLQSPETPCGANPQNPDQECDTANGFICLHTRVETGTCHVCSGSSGPCNSDCHRAEKNVCARPNENCLDFAGDCSEEEICPIHDPAHEQVTPGLDAPIPPGPTDPAVLFGPPKADRVPTDPWDDDSEVPCNGFPAQACQGPNTAHAWCNYDLGGNETLNTRELADGSRHGSAGSGKLIEFNFDPRLVARANAVPHSLGASELDLHAEASLTAGAKFSVVGITRNLEIVDIGAALAATRCSVTAPSNAARFEVLGVDFLPTLIGNSGGLQVPGVEGIPYSSDTPNDQQAACNSAWNGFENAVDRAKKAMKDARDLLQQYNTAKAAGKRFSQSLFTELGALPPSDFEAPAGDEAPESTINRFVDYYEKQIDNLFLEPVDLPFGAATIPFTIALISVPRHDETQLIAQANFPIGPIPCTMELEGVVRYGADVSADAEIRPQVAITRLLVSKDAVDEEDTLAFIRLNGTPSAGAAVRLFVGAGFGANGFEAKAGVEGEISIGNVAAPTYAGIGVNLAASQDPRPIPTALQALQNAPGDVTDTFIHPKEYHYRLNYFARSSVGVSNVLDGSLSAKVKISFFFFSKTWRQVITTFTGFCQPVGTPPQPPPQCSQEIFSVEDSAKWGTIRMPMPFVKLKHLGFVPLDESKPTETFSKDAVGRFFYDRMCVLPPIP